MLALKFAEWNAQAYWVFMNWRGFSSKSQKQYQSWLPIRATRTLTNTAAKR